MTERATARRLQRHQQVVQEIKQVAWQQLEREGAAGLSMRMIARELGMVPSALYRYLASRDDLINELVIDSFGGLADALAAADARARRRSGLRRWLAATAAFRQWALEHRSAFALVFGPPIPDYQPPDDRSLSEFNRVVAVLFAVMVDAVAAGELDPGRLPAPSAALRRQLTAWGRSAQVELTPAALLACQHCWAHLLGAVAVELHNHVPPELAGSRELFEAQMRMVLAPLQPTG